MLTVKSLSLLRTPSGRRDTTRWMTALFAIVALLWQSVVPLLAPAPKAADDLVVICTAHGFKTVSLSSLSTEVDESGDSKSRQTLQDKVDCPLCPGGHAGAACLPGSAPLQIAQATTGLAMAVAEQRPVFGPARFETFYSRAPPVVA